MTRVPLNAIEPTGTSSNAATGAPAVVAVTRMPSGATATESPCDIHTDRSSGCPLKRVEVVSDTIACVALNSESPVFDRPRAPEPSTGSRNMPKTGTPARAAPDPDSALPPRRPTTDRRRG